MNRHPIEQGCANSIPLCSVTVVPGLKRSTTSKNITALHLSKLASDGAHFRHVPVYDEQPQKYNSISQTNYILTHPALTFPPFEFYASLSLFIFGYDSMVSSPCHKRTKFIFSDIVPFTKGTKVINGHALLLLLCPLLLVVFHLVFLNSLNSFTLIDVS